MTQMRKEVDLPHAIGLKLGLGLVLDGDSVPLGQLDLDLLVFLQGCQELAGGQGLRESAVLELPVPVQCAPSISKFPGRLLLFSCVNFPCFCPVRPPPRSVCLLAYSCCFPVLTSHVSVQCARPLDQCVSWHTPVVFLC